MEKELRLYLKEEVSKRMKRAHYVDMRMLRANKVAENKRALIKEAGATDTTDINNLIVSPRVSAIETAPDVAFLGTPPLPQ